MVGDVVFYYEIEIFGVRLCYQVEEVLLGVDGVCGQGFYCLGGGV